MSQLAVGEMASLRPSKRRAPRHDTVLARGGRLIVVATFAVIAIAAAVGTTWDLRAAAANRTIAAATAAAGTPAGSAALNDAADVLRGAQPTSELRDLAAALALLTTPSDLDTVERLSASALAASPARAETFARLAYIDVLRNGALTQTGAQALQDSYLAAPYAEQSLRRWRLEFTLGLWSQIDPSLRSTALSEANVAARVWSERVWMVAMAERMPGPAAEALIGVVTD